jgi:hypothetical protein
MISMAIGVTIVGCVVYRTVLSEFELRESPRPTDTVDYSHSRVITAGVLSVA